jgi:DNA-binding transcriptional ArsR family regulator
VPTYRANGIEALGDPTRRAIFERLAAGPLAVGDLARQMPVSRPAVSQHLKVLLAAGLVTAHEHGTRRLYEVDPAGVGALRAYLEQSFHRALPAYKRAAEQTRSEEDR